MNSILVGRFNITLNEVFMAKIFENAVKFNGVYLMHFINLEC